jgi:hypothetical protein
MMPTSLQSAAVCEGCHDPLDHGEELQDVSFYFGGASVPLVARVCSVCALSIDMEPAAGGSAIESAMSRLVERNGGEAGRFVPVTCDGCGKPLARDDAGRAMREYHLPASTVILLYAVCGECNAVALRQEAMQARAIDAALNRLAVMPEGGAQ